MFNMAAPAQEMSLRSHRTAAILVRKISCPIMPAPPCSATRKSPIGRDFRPRVAWLAAMLLALTGCASDRAIQHRESAAAGPMLRPVGAEASKDRACRAHDPTSPELAKQRRAIDPLRVPALYSELFYGAQRDSQAAFQAGGMSLRRYRQFDDPDSGLSGFVLLDDASGHALILFKGMDRPFAERGGLGGVLTDLGGALAAKFGTGNGQLFRADDAYTEALCEELIKSIELVGYSMGSQIANYLAVKYGAYAVVFGDMGLDSTLLKRHARGDVRAARALAREHIVSLSLGGDLVVRMFGVGEVVGTVVELPGALAGVLHQPEVYANAANAAIRDRDAARGAAAAASRPNADVTRSSTGGSTGSAADAHRPSGRH
jgi:hypothetical protein